jgi:hypothetical protein
MMLPLLMAKFYCSFPSADSQAGMAKINLHPHLRFLVTEGGVAEAREFHKVARIEDPREALPFPI